MKMTRIKNKYEPMATKVASCLFYIVNQSFSRFSHMRSDGSVASFTSSFSSRKIRAYSDSLKIVCPTKFFLVDTCSTHLSNPSCVLNVMKALTGLLNSNSSQLSIVLLIFSSVADILRRFPLMRSLPLTLSKSMSLLLA